MITGIVWIIIGAFAIASTFRGDPGSVLILVICLLGLVTSIVFCGMAISDLRSPRTIEGRVTECRLLCVKGVSGRNSDRWGYRITIADDNGNETIFRGPEDIYHVYPPQTADFVHFARQSRYPDGDIVCAKVGMRLRWLYEIEPIGFSTPPDPKEVQAKLQRDRELTERVEADPQAALEELMRKRAELEANHRQRRRTRTPILGLGARRKQQDE
jgi:hypothetical protein